MRGLRNFLHRFRNYFLPADYVGYARAVRTLRERGAPVTREPSALFDFTKPIIDKDLGRYAFNLVREFLDAGYAVYLPPSFWFLSSVHRKLFKRLLLEQPVHLFQAGASEQPRPTLLLTDRESSPYRGRCAYEIRLDYRSRLHRNEGLTLFPYRQAPQFNLDPGMPRWPDLEDEGRPIAVSFFGHFKHRDYDNTRALAEFGAHGRRDLIETLLRELAPEQLFVAGRGSSAERQGAGKFVLGKDEELPILPEYARLLRHSNYFLCCPGTGFLLCHNMIESMLMGCIPIVERPELTGLPLVAGENCLSFRGLAGLVETVKECLADGAERAPRMRARLRDVVRDHLEPGSFAAALDVKSGRLPESLALFWFERAR
jgi:hypothetical protein